MVIKKVGFCARPGDGTLALPLSYERWQHPSHWGEHVEVHEICFLFFCVEVHILLSRGRDAASK